ncbi:MAG: hypothetical protein ACLFVI_00185 [Archaeoglobaceae archaeon]
MKLKSYLVLAFILFCTLSFSLCVQEAKEDGYKVPTPSRETPTTTPTPTPTPVQMNIIGGDCLNCHYNQNRTYVAQADKIAGHLDASDQCIYCHIENAASISEDEVISRIHSLHSEIYDDCFTCHKQDLSIEPDCGDCHVGEDMLQPSDGNVFAIHSPVDVGCGDCHGDFMSIHRENKLFPEKFYFP